MSTPSTAMQAQQAKRHVINPTTPAPFTATTPKSQPTPSTNNNHLLPAFSSPAHRGGGNLSGKSPAAAGAFGRTFAQSALGVGAAANSPANASTASFSGLEGLGMMKLSMSNPGLSMSNLGLSNDNNNNNNNNDDNERRKRLEAVLATLRPKTGRVGQDGLERVSRRCGFDNMWEVDARTGRRTLQIAGNAVLIGVEFKSKTSSIPDAVVVESDALGSHQMSTAAILHRNLTPPPGTFHINVMLDQFAGNLERLARMEQLSVPGVSCMEAILGVFGSLKRLYEYEEKAAETLLGPASSPDDIERHVTCSRSGRPQMNVRGRVGLSLDYWTFAAAHAQDDSNPFSAVIECEDTLPALYPTIRVSQDWLSTRVVVSEDAADLSLPPPIEWLDPPPPPSTANPPSHARFTARLDPPLIVPLATAAQIYASVGIDTSQDAVSASSTLDSILVAGPAVGSATPHLGRRKREHRVLRTLPVPYQHEHVTYALALLPARETLAREVTHIPFAHPRQIVALLPVLRQWAAVNALVRATFPPGVVAHAASGGGDGYEDEDVEAALARLLRPESDAVAVAVADTTTNTTTTTTTTTNTIPAAAADASSSSANKRKTTHAHEPRPRKRRSLDVAISALPGAPVHFTLVMPYPRASARASVREQPGLLASIRFAVGLDGVVQVVGEDVLGLGTGTGFGARGVGGGVGGGVGVGARRNDDDDVGDRHGRADEAVHRGEGEVEGEGEGAVARDTEAEAEAEGIKKVDGRLEEEQEDENEKDRETTRQQQQQHKALVAALHTCQGDFALWAEWLHQRLFSAGIDG